ncbi:MAG: phosphoenolpyruvate kinase [Myxococcaceae bacterium]|nr:phosphoenolpyruvate kinase [Myxococcaceae bacterium]
MNTASSVIDQAQAELEALGRANRAFMQTYPGDRTARQPVHTVYGGAQLYKADTTRRLGELALHAMENYGRDPFEFALGVGFVSEAALERLSLSDAQAAFAEDPAALRREHAGAWSALTVYARVREKLVREPVEDFRIDFEDGFGARPDAEEDATAIAAAHEVARGLREHSLPPFLGIRIKSFGEEWKLRGARTLELFLDTLLADSHGVMPDNFVVTLPKVTVAEQPRTLIKLLSLLEHRHALPSGTLKMELMVEVTQALLGSTGRSPLPEFLEACQGRCTGAHFGTYDYTASCNITASFQAMDHPMCDLAKGMMLLAYAGTGVFLSDGATNVMPVAPHPGKSLSPEQTLQNRAAVHAAWQLASRHIRHSLEGGFYQGWDLHPAQLPVRYATCYAFFLESFAQAAERLANFVDKSAHATLVGDVFDDAATGQGLLNYFLRALNCGAITLEDVAQTGLTEDEFALRSFAKILSARRDRLQQA